MGNVSFFYPNVRGTSWLNPTSLLPWDNSLKKATTADADCSFLGVFLAVCGLGLYFLPDKHAIAFPAGDAKKELVKQWLGASASALTLARFMDGKLPAPLLSYMY